MQMRAVDCHNAGSAEITIFGCYCNRSCSFFEWRYNTVLYSRYGIIAARPFDIFIRCSFRRENRGERQSSVSCANACCFPVKRNAGYGNRFFLNADFSRNNVKIHIVFIGIADISLCIKDRNRYIAGLCALRYCKSEL